MGYLFQKLVKTNKNAKEKNISVSDVSNFEAIQGKGLKGTNNGKEYFVGNAKLVSDLKVPFDTAKLNEFTSQGKTPVILATKEKVLGFVMVADEIKAESVEAVKNLHKLGIKVVMLTGDNEKTAQDVAQRLGITEFHASMKSEEKLWSSWLIFE